MWPPVVPLCHPPIAAEGGGGDLWVSHQMRLAARSYPPPAGGGERRGAKPLCIINKNTREV